MKIIIAVDVQKDFINGSLGSEWAQEVAPKIEKYLVEQSKKPETYILFTKDTHYEDYLKSFEGQRLPVKHCIVDTDGWKLYGNLEETFTDAYTVQKSTFGSSILPRTISYRCPDLVSRKAEFEIFGFCTSICVSANALNLRMNYPNSKITVLSDLCADISKENHEAALKVMQANMIDISTLEK